VTDQFRQRLLDAVVEVVRLAGDEKERSGLAGLLYDDEVTPNDQAALAVLRRASRRVPGAWQRG
jgi:hypothetical protein